jgi:hypothetical protein
MHGQRFVFAVDGERRRRNHRHGQLDARHRRDIPGDVLRKVAAPAARHLERRTPGHRVDDFDEGAQHRPVDEIHRADQRDAEPQRQHAERQPHPTAAQKAQRQAEAQHSAHASTWLRSTVAGSAAQRDDVPRGLRR